MIPNLEETNSVIIGESCLDPRVKITMPLTVYYQMTEAEITEYVRQCFQAMHKRKRKKI